jgi:RNA polymerase sigma factor (sigma-70 family)
MAPNESELARPRCESCTHEQNRASESQFFPGPKTPWGKFYRSQTERLSRIATKMRVPPDQIADVVQEVWLDAFKHREKFQGENVDQRLSSWLSTVVVHKSINVLRRVHRRPTESLDDLAAEPIDHKADDPEERMEAKEEAETLAVILQGLRKKNPLNYRLVCDHVLEERSLQDLSASTGLGIHAISCRISRTLKELRSQLLECHSAEHADA